MGSRKKISEGDVLSISNPLHIRAAALRISLGDPMMCHFGNFIAIVSRPDSKAVQYVNITKGRPKDHIGSITTVRRYIRKLFDWSKVPKEIDCRELKKLMDDLCALGPIGFRGPAAEEIPDHLTQKDGGMRTVQIISPGYACLSNRLIAEVLQTVGEKFLHATSPNVSRHLTGNKEEPAHYKMKELQKDFSGKPGYFAIAHENEDIVRASYPKHVPMSTSILAFHKAVTDSKGKVSLILERHGSLHFKDIRDIARNHGFGLVKSGTAKKRLLKRTYRA
ncbi:hypothetical protein L0Y69_02225 [bacterium]|nr:hypothetical protein [bacterium]